MPASRLLLHPLLTHKKSRLIFAIFLVLAVLLGILCWVRLNNAFHQAGLSVMQLQGTGFHGLILLSPYVRFAIIGAAAIIAASLTAHHVIGPVKRMEQWLHDVEAGLSVSPLKVRRGDKFSMLVDMINRLASRLPKTR